MHVIVHAHGNLSRAEEVAAAIRAGGGTADAVAFDVTDAEASRAAIDALLEAGPVQVVVNNAGIHDDAPLAGMRRHRRHAKLLNDRRGSIASSSSEPPRTGAWIYPVAGRANASAQHRTPP